MAEMHDRQWIHAGSPQKESSMYPTSTESSPRKPSNRQSQHDWQSQFQLPTTAHSTYQITPPSTPSHSETDYSGSGHSLFHNYLRALHPYDPRSRVTSEDEDDGAASTASIKPGDLILVHCVHANGWADGTVINTGARGWLPTNYCEVYDHVYIRNLLNATTTFWDLLGVTEEGNLSTFVRQDYIRGLIAGVRSLLERTDCLHRDSPLVTRHAGVRRMRKGLLADLSSLVQIAKRLQEAIAELSMDGDAVPSLVDDLVTKAFKVVTRAVSFLDVWTQDVSSAKAASDATSGRATPLSRGRTLAPIDSSVKRASVTINTPADSAKYLPSPDEVEQRQAVTAGTDPEQKRLSVTRVRASMVFTPPAGQVAHRMSFVQRTSVQFHSSSGPLASEELAKVHDVCISEIGAYIGNHFNSRQSSELVATTERLVQACRKMLAIIREVTSRDPLASQPLHQARIDLETKVDELEHYAKEVFHFSDSPDEEIVMLPDQSNHLIRVGTSLIRNTGGCVVETKQIIERIGDFELSGKMWSSPAPNSDSAALPVSAVDALQEQKPSGQDAVNPKRQSLTKRLSTKMLPPPPPMPSEGLPATEESPSLATPLPSTPDEHTVAIVEPPSLEPTSSVRTVRKPEDVAPANSGAIEGGKSPRSSRSDSSAPPSPARQVSGGMSVTDFTDASSSARHSSLTEQSETSTRATTPDHQRDSQGAKAERNDSVGSLSSLPNATADDSSDAESQLLQKTYANELTWNKDGNVTGGSLPALVEQLTTHDSAPDAQFVSAFFLTFRRFADPRDFAQALIDRFDYIGESRDVGMPARLRIYNIFKMWIEAHWIPEADKEALGEIRYFAMHKLKHQLPSAAERLVELTRRAAAAYQNGNAPSTSGAGIGKNSIAVARVPGEHYSVPDLLISKNQLNVLRIANGGGAACMITDFEPMEMARQFTLLVMNKFCLVKPQELLSMDWNNANTKKAKNVRQMCFINTDIAHMVGDSILAHDEPKKRAHVLKHWIKIATACQEIGNYDTIMAIMCTINSSVIQRLKRTWDLIHKKTRARLDELNFIVDISKNHANLRRRLDTLVAPCMPFLGIYLTDLTFVFAGNPKRRELPGSMSETGQVVSVINFDMYARIARIIANLQQFQHQYPFKPLPEMQTWLEGQLAHMREGSEDMLHALHLRSLAVEPRAGCQTALQQSQSSNQSADVPPPPLASQRRRGTVDDRGRSESTGIMEHRFDFLLKGTSALSHGLRSINSHSDLHALTTPIPEGAEQPAAVARGTAR